MDWSRLDHHDRIAVSFSGGKDSTLVLWLLREAGLLDRVTVYHQDTGDLFPEVVAHVAAVAAWCKSFIHLRSDARGWATIHGEPSDLVPYSAHPIGQARHDGGRVAHRFDCCAANLMMPLHERVLGDGNTLVIRGTRDVDMPHLPVVSGDVVDGVEYLYPIQAWTDDEVFAFIAAHKIPLPSLYDHFRQGPECATCPAWWNVDNGPYLRARHPGLHAEYEARMSRVVGEVVPCLRHLMPMLDGFKSTGVSK